MYIVFALLTTLAIETGIYMILEHKSYKLLVTVSLLNIVLNISMNMALEYLISSESMYYWVLSICEVSTVLIESAVIFLVCKYKPWKILLISLIANACSLGVGLLFNNIIKNTTAMLVMSFIFGFVYLAAATYVVVFYIKKKLTPSC